MTILNDTIYAEYRGEYTGTSTALDRQIAYNAAEQLVERWISSPLDVRNVTGTFSWPHANGIVTLEHINVRRVHRVLGIYANPDKRQDYFATGSGFVRAGGDAGQVTLFYPDVPPTLATRSTPDRAQVVYEAGVGRDVVTGTAQYLRALVLVAEEELEQLVAPHLAEGGKGGAGVESFSDSGYSERRFGLKATGLGSSPRANHAARLLRPLKGRRV